jgi:hypothetical protein
MGFIDKVKENIHEAATTAREGAEEMRTKHELGQAYGELGRRAFDLVDAGKLQMAELDFDVERIRKLRAELEAEERPVTGVPTG